MIYVFSTRTIDKIEIKYLTCPLEWNYFGFEIKDYVEEIATI
jgi:hypothetical protein